MREKAILKRIKDGERTVPGIVKQVYAGVDERLHAAAAMSTLAHVEHLVEQELVKAHGPIALETEYEAL